MPRKTNSKNNAESSNEEKPARGRTTKRTTTKRANEQDQRAGVGINQINDHERAFAQHERDRGEVF